MIVSGFVAEVKAYPLQAAVTVMVVVRFVVAVGAATFIDGDTQCVGSPFSVYHGVRQFDDAFLSVYAIGHGAVFSLYS